VASQGKDDNFLGASDAVVKAWIHGKYQWKKMQS